MIEDLLQIVAEAAAAAEREQRAADRRAAREGKVAAAAEGRRGRAVDGRGLLGGGRAGAAAEIDEVCRFVCVCVCVRACMGI